MLAEERLRCRPMGGVWAIVVAGGSGSRFGESIPKQFLDLGGLRLHRLGAGGSRRSRATASSPSCRPPTSTPRLPAGVTAVAGGATRSASVRAGLAAVPDDAGVDRGPRRRPAPGRPGAVRAGHRRRAGRGRRRRPGRARGRHDQAGRPERRAGRSRRSTGRRCGPIQTPQAFAADALRRAHAGGADATDDAALVEAAGGRVVVVEGDPANLKVTGPDDLVRAEALLTRRAL